MKNLSEKLMIVNLSISQWSGRKHDKEISRQIEKEHNTTNAGRYNKILINEDELKDCQSIASGARAYLYTQTLPWGDNGDRVLPATNYLKFVEEFRPFKEKFEVAYQGFLQKYLKVKEDARIRLNGMFKEGDYPTTAALRQKFKLAITIMPISEPTDFRVQLDQEEVANLRCQIQNEINDRIESTTRDIWERIKKVVDHMADKLSSQDAIFRDSLVNNIRELIDVIPRLNFTQNEDINEVLRQMKTLAVDPDTLRTNSGFRNEKAEEAKALSDKINAYFEM